MTIANSLNDLIVLGTLSSMSKTPPVQVWSAGHREPKMVPDRSYPSQLSAWEDSSLRLGDVGTHYGSVGSGSIMLICSAGRFEISKGMYFSVPGQLEIVGTGHGFVATRLDYRGFFQVGGPAEPSGRLAYIDGCSDSLLIAPPVLGDPCLNLLHLPPGTEQTQHTHPSCRIGMVAEGHGVCRTPEGDFDLCAGNIFQMAPEAVHSFHTGAHSLRVLAWHPDSDTGPSHQDHPMINRTIVKGISAARLNHLQTRWQRVAR